MTEQEWLTCAYPHRMLHFVCFNIKPDNRKRRLFANHCCRRCWDSFTDERSRNAVETSEQFVEEQATAQDLIAVGKAAFVVALELRASLENARREGVRADTKAALLLAKGAADVAWLLADKMAWETLGEMAAAAYSSSGMKDEPSEATRRSVLCDVLRDIFGNPFRPITIDTQWLTPKVVVFAQTIYEERRYEDMPILADALEEAGCTNADMLNHCRSREQHVRGCWVLDLILGKQ